MRQGKPVTPVCWKKSGSACVGKALQPAHRGGLPRLDQAVCVVSRQTPPKGHGGNGGGNAVDTRLK